jgi:hypothetical protein
MQQGNFIRFRMQPFPGNECYDSILFIALKNNAIPWAARGQDFHGRTRNCLCAGAVLLLILSSGLCASASTEAVAAKQSTAAPVDGISFLTKKTRLWEGRSQLIFFRLGQPSPDDRYYSFQLDEKAVHLLMPPRVLKGETLGYMRVQPLVEGKTQIHVEDAKLDIEIVPDAAMNHIAELNPQITAPASGSNVWGSFAVGVEQLSLADPTELPLPVLRLPDGKEITGHVVPDQKPGPHARWAFTVDSSALVAGSNKLIAVQKDAAGKEIQSNPAYVTLIKPSPDTLQSGNCQDKNSGDRTANDGSDPPKVIDDDKYSQGKILEATEAGRSWCLPVSVTKKGQYQMFITARGEFAGDALPTIGVQLDEEGGSATTARLATTEWQRIPVGHPFSLEAGNHIISVRNLNELNHGPDNTRTLYFQKYELACIDKPDAKLASDAGGAMGGMQSMAAMTAMTGGGAAASGTDGLSIAFTDNIDGKIVAGAVEVGAMCWWPDREHSPPPRVQLFVNKRLVSMQSTGQPRFTIDPSAFAVGPNTIELRAVLPTGAWAKSVPMTVQVTPDFPLPKTPFRPSVVFTTYDSGLSSTMTPPEPHQDPGFALFAGNGESTVKLPDELTGAYKVEIEARGDSFKGPPLMSVKLKSNAKETKLGEIPVASNKWGFVQAGRVDLASGPKDLAVGFTNDAYEKDKGDRNLYVKSIHLVPVEDTPDKVAPRIAIAYSPKVSSAGKVDAVVARVMDNERVASADLLVDDQPQHLDLAPSHGLGEIVFPLLTRDLAPGRHRLKVVAHDDAGNVGTSPEIALTVSALATTAPSKYERALFLLNRFGYGPDPDEIAAILIMGEQPWLESRLAQDATSPAEANELESIHAQFADPRNGYQVAMGAIEYLLSEPNPVRARFMMWTENHFSTWLNKDGPLAKEREHESFLQLGPVPFFDLLFTSATSPAMLVYLDQRYSYARHLNENYAREIMELHTLGVKGGYTQKDVTTLADLLTGWTLSDEAPNDGSGGELERFFSYDPHMNSGNGCRILGVEFPGTETARRFDRPLMALEMLSAHPSCATFISRKLCEQYVSDPAPPKLVDDLAQIYLETGGDIRAMLVAMAGHADFWSSPGKVANPLDFSIRIARMARSTNAQPVNDLISGSSMGMFDRSTPDGYPEDNGFGVNSSTLLQRWRFARTIQNDFIGAGLIPDSWKPADTGWNPAIAQRIVDLAAVRITGDVLSDASNSAAQKLLADAPPNTDIRLHALTTFICQLPENSLR